MFSLEDTLMKALIEHALSDSRGKARWHITRLRMYKALERQLAKFDSPNATCLCISHSDPLAKVLGLDAAKKVITGYPDVDMLSLPYADDSFDFVVSDQVLEHIGGDPFQAVRESVRVTRPGGYIVHTTCFINFLHQLPADYWRFSEESLRLLASAADASVVSTGAWGNRDAWIYMQLGYRSNRVPEVEGNPIYELGMRNDKRWPVTTWVVMKKP